MKRTMATVAASGLLAAVAGAASAHHSFALFNTAKDVSISGVVKDFQWTNPHIFVQLQVANGQGGSDEWAIEGSSTNTLRRTGWTRTSFKPGDRVTIVMHPLKDGQKGGAFVRATFADGHVLSEVADLGGNSVRTKTQD